MGQDSLLTQKKFIEGFLGRQFAHLSAFTFANIFIWSDFFGFRFEVINNFLCVFADHSSGTFLYLPPLGKITDKMLFCSTIAECFEKMEAVNRGNDVSRVENMDQSRLGFVSGSSGMSSYRKSYDICYFREDMAGLKGNDFKSKRSSYNYFVKNYRHFFQPFTTSMREDCCRLYDRWAENRLSKYQKDIYAQLIHENRIVHRLAMEYQKQLGLVGRVVEVDGKIAGYTFGLPVHPDVFCVLFEIVDLTINGLGVYIFKTFCDDPQLKPYSLINVMDDFEMDNIKEIKESFHPVLLVPSYTVTQK